MTNNKIQLKQWLTIRQPIKSEAAIIAELISNNINQAFAQHSKEELKIWEMTYSISELEKQITEREVFILQYKKALTGTIQLHHNEIKGFYTSPRGVGFGNILLDFMVTRLKVAGFEWCQLVSNEWAVSFYEKHRFKVLAKTTMYYDGHPFEEYFMRREFSRPRA